VIGAIIEEIKPKPAGRPAKPAEQAALEAENERLRADLEALQIRTESIERLLNVVGGIASGKTPLPRTRAKKTKPEDPEPAIARKKAVVAMREQGATLEDCGEALGISVATVRRDLKPTCCAPKPIKPRDPHACQQVRTIVRATHALVGAQSLSRMTGLPRRACAEIKRNERRELERERKARCQRVVFAEPGIVRGFDAMHVETTDAKAYWLVAADAAIPYRTSIATVPTYDAEHVIAALVADFEENGAPLVLRLDRISCQRTDEVLAMLARYEVLPLHGPPRHPYYYGQLERQNREHREWYAMLGAVTPAELSAAGEAMRTSLNALWSRPTLDGWTAEQAWRVRKPIHINRRELRRDVERCVSGLVSSGVELLRAQRIATERALIERELLTINREEAAR
jgi:transposase InsO family protein